MGFSGEEEGGRIGPRERRAENSGPQITYFIPGSPSDILPKDVMGFMKNATAEMSDYAVIVPE